jgi:hypothetical protein
MKAQLRYVPLLKTSLKFLSILQGTYKDAFLSSTELHYENLVSAAVITSFTY